MRVPVALLWCGFGSTRAFTALRNNKQRRHGIKTRLHSVVSETASGKKFMVLTKDQDKELRTKGEEEARLMKYNMSPLKANKVRAVGGSGGFGGGGKKPNLKAQAKEHAKVLKREGLVRIDNVLTSKLASELRDYLIDLRKRGTADIEAGVVQESQERFADVLLNQNRCDLKIPLGPPAVNDALHHVLTKTCIRHLIQDVFESYGGGGSQATLYELNCFMSNSGARRQLVHTDNACVSPETGLHPDEPIMLTCFIALQDVDATMGPTVWIPGTHNVESHDLFYETNKGPNDSESTKDVLLRDRPKVVGTLPRGSCVVFDPRTLHCAGANVCNDPDKTRALFYISFKNPRVDSPGCPSCSGYGVATAGLTLKQLCNELEAEHTGSGDTTRLDALACFP